MIPHFDDEEGGYSMKTLTAEKHQGNRQKVIQIEIESGGSKLETEQLRNACEQSDLDSSSEMIIRSFLRNSNNFTEDSCDLFQHLVFLKDYTVKHPHSTFTELTKNDDGGSDGLNIDLKDTFTSCINVLNFDTSSFDTHNVTIAVGNRKGKNMTQNQTDFPVEDIHSSVYSFQGNEETKENELYAIHEVNMQEMAHKSESDVSGRRWNKNYFAEKYHVILIRRLFFMIMILNSVMIILVLLINNSSIKTSSSSLEMSTSQTLVKAQTSDLAYTFSPSFFKPRTKALHLSRSNKPSSLPSHTHHPIVASDINTKMLPSITPITSPTSDQLITMMKIFEGFGLQVDTYVIQNGAECYFTGVICMNGNVVHLDLSNKGLRGTLPSQLFDLQSLKYLSIGYNEISGSVPTHIGNLLSLEYISFHENKLVGSIPTDIGKLKFVKKLKLRNNALTGKIPSEIGLMHSLDYLTLFYNSFSGSIPTQIANLQRLHSLWLNFNRFSGSIPSDLGRMYTLEKLYLNTNKLNGSIPTELGDMNAMKKVNLRNNFLTGSIPKQLANMASLQSLEVEENNLTGTAPHFVCYLRSFTYDITKVTIDCN